MKLKKTWSFAIVAMALIVAAGAAAMAKDSTNMLLRYDVTVAGSHLARGSYDVQWQTQRPAATVSFLQKNKVVATAEGKVVDRGKTFPSNEVVYDQTADGARVIQELRFKGSSEVIVFNE